MISSRFHADVDADARIKEPPPPKHSFQRVIFCWFTNISQPFSHLQYTGKQSPPFYPFFVALIECAIFTEIKLIQSI